MSPQPRPFLHAVAGGGARLSLLNGFDLRCEGRAVSLPPNGQRLLALLALRDEPLLRVDVADTLWLDSSEERAQANLRSALWRLRSLGHRLLETSGQQLRLAADVEVDVHAALRLARALIGGAPAPEQLRADPGVLACDLLPAWYEDWVLIERERFRQLRLHALDRLCERLTATGQLGAALQAGLAAVAADPVRESAHRALIRVHLAEGNHGEAMRQYRLFRGLLHEQLGLAPSRQIEELLGDLRPSARDGAVTTP